MWKLFIMFGWVYTLWAIYQNANLYFRLLFTVFLKRFIIQRKKLNKYIADYTKLQ